LIRVPAPAVNGTSTTAPAEAKIALTCVCGKNLKVPQSAVGKSVRCSCGEVLMVAGVQQAEAESYGIGTGTQSEDWLGGAMPYPAAHSPPSNFPMNASPYCAPSSGNTNPNPPSYTKDYLRHAQQDRVTRRANEHHEASTELHAARSSSSAY
jgi:hypothetical protein